MQSVWQTFKRFLHAEEVPRWFGLSIVLIYLVGLGSVAQWGINQARREGALYFQRGSVHAVTLMGRQLASIPADGAGASLLIMRYTHILREFVQNIPVRWVRVVDRESRVIASTVAEQIGSVVESSPTSLTVPGQPEITPFPTSGSSARDALVRMWFTVKVRGAPTKNGPVSDSAATNAADPAWSTPMPAGGALLCLEARLPPQPPALSSFAGHARTLAVVLAVLGALFVVYRCLREQLRGMSRIADRLQSNQDELENELNALHIADTVDNVTTAWNELIALTQRLRETVRRSEAAEELTRALQSASGGALAEALNAVPDGILYITDDGRFEYMNAAAARFFGWNRDATEDVSLAGAQANTMGTRVLDALRAARQSDGFFKARIEIISTDDTDDREFGSYRISVFPLQHARRQSECVVLIRDVSQQVRADRAREEFITQVTHELRTPLTNIRAYTETLSSGMFDDPNLTTECYNVITKETRRLSRLIEDILSVSQLEVGTIELAVADVDLKTLLADAVRDVRGLADDKDIDIQLVLPPKLELIRADRDKLAVVANNLLGNAIKYTPSNGNVLLGCQFASGEVVVTIKDNGIGIDAADQARIFEKFQRAEDPEVQSETGTGIGLYTAREIVRSHGGEIELISEKGKGSTFLVHLPHQESRAAALATAEEA